MMKTEWRRYREYLIDLMIYLDVDSLEYKSLRRRINWIWHNRL